MLVKGFGVVRKQGVERGTNSSKIPAYFLAEHRPTQSSGVMEVSLPAEVKVAKLEFDPKHPSRTKSPMLAGSLVNEPVGVGAGTSVASVTLT